MRDDPARRKLSYTNGFPVGRLAQLGEHLVYTQGVTGSSPVPPTKVSNPRRYNRIDNAVRGSIRDGKIGPQPQEFRQRNGSGTFHSCWI